MDVRLLLSLPVFIMAVMLHELAHGFVAFRLGDNTAKDSGRLTLNPLVHVDPIGTVVVPFVLYATGSPVIFGWAKPVPVNFRNLSKPRRDSVLVSVAGITANLILALIFALILKTHIYGRNTYGYVLLNMGILVNLMLAVFNALPIPPLDGSHILMGFLPPKAAFHYAKLSRYGFLILIMLLYMGLIRAVIWPIVTFLYAVLVI
jgi:Zn-dependent protease